MDSGVPFNWSLRALHIVGGTQTVQVRFEALARQAASQFDNPATRDLLDAWLDARYAGEAALVQRCQANKRRNVLEQLPEEYQPGIDRKLLAAYAMVEHADARRALEQLHKELDRINPSAARSLEEGMEGPYAPSPCREGLI